MKLDEYVVFGDVHGDIARWHSQQINEPDNEENERVE